MFKITAIFMLLGFCSGKTNLQIKNSGVVDTFKSTSLAQTTLTDRQQEEDDLKAAHKLMIVGVCLYIVVLPVIILPEFLYDREEQRQEKGKWRLYLTNDDSQDKQKVKVIQDKQKLDKAKYVACRIIVGVISIIEVILFAIAYGLTNQYAFANVFIIVISSLLFICNIRFYLSQISIYP